VVIVCLCEGRLENAPSGEVVRCTRCPRTFPTKEALQVLKLLRLAARETDNDGKPANEHVRRLALKKATYRMAALKLKAIDESELQPVAPPPPPPAYYRDPTYVTVSTSGFYGNSTINNIRVTFTRRPFG
jgi:hypothetical protein